MYVQNAILVNEFLGSKWKQVIVKEFSKLVFIYINHEKLKVAFKRLSTCKAFALKQAIFGCMQLCIYSSMVGSTRRTLMAP
jgi:hypothetical protein